MHHSRTSIRDILCIIFLFIYAHIQYNIYNTVAKEIFFFLLKLHLLVQVDEIFYIEK